jgi:dUTP pyrophosphatase
MIRFFLSDKARKSGVQFCSPRSGDAGFDIMSCISFTLESGVQIGVSTGLHLAIPDGWVGLISDRSSLASKQVYTHGGVIDSSYRGEVIVLLRNHSPSSFSIREGDRIAQMVVVPHLKGVLQECLTAGELGETERGSGGFGSTGS